MALTREQILAANDVEMEEVPIPEWGGTVFVRSIGATAKERIGQAMIGEDGKPRNMIGFRALFASQSIVDEHGNLIFSAADLESLGTKCESALDKILDVGRRLSKMDREAVEAEVGNSSGGQSADSTSA
jgi:hypothetical protein